jgi:hypothetical protein
MVDYELQLLLAKVAEYEKQIIGAAQALPRAQHFSPRSPAYHSQLRSSEAGAAANTPDPARPTSSHAWFGAGTLIFRAGALGAQPHLVATGVVDIYLQDQRVATVGAGGVVGVLRARGKQTHGLTAIARTDCTLVPIDLTPQPTLSAPAA